MNLQSSIELCLTEKSEINDRYGAMRSAILARVPLTNDLFEMLSESGEHAAVRAALARLDDARICAAAAADQKHFARL